MKEFIKYFCLVGSIIFTVISLSVFSIRAQLLNPENYTRALQDANVYAVTADIIETKVTGYLVTAGKNVVDQFSQSFEPDNQVVTRVEPLVVGFLYSLIDRETGKLVDQMFTKLQVENLLQNTSQGAIIYFVDWLANRKEDPKFFTYIPTPEKLENVRTEGVVPFIVSEVKNNAGLEDLPPCQNVGEITANINFLAQGKLDEISCYSPEIRAVVGRTGQVVKPKLAKTQLAITINNYLEQYQVKTLAEDLFDSFINIAYIKQNLYDFRNTITQTKQWAINGFIISLVLLIIGIILTEKHRLKTIFLAYLISGATMVIIAVIEMITTNYYIYNSVPKTLILITDPAISEVQKLALSTSLRQAAVYITQDLVSGMLALGLLMTAIAIGGVLTLRIIEKRHAQEMTKEPVTSETSTKKKTTRKKK